MSAHGAVDLGALAAAREAQAKAAERAAQNADSGVAVPLVYDVTEATFQAEVIDRSFQVPVVIDLWAEWCGPCKTLSPILERLAEADGGKWVLAKVDVDAEPNISAAFRVQSIPTIVALIKGQPVPLFQGALPEQQVRQYLDELIKVAVENGVTGITPAAEAETVAEPEQPVDTRFDVAFDAFEAGDWDGAEAAYKDILASSPDDPDAKAGLTRVQLMRRVDGADPGEAVSAANAAPADVGAAKLAADIEILTGNNAAAFNRLIDAVRLNSGDEREDARQHLLGLFELVDPSDPDVLKARTGLANALF